jgi:hypothetical protein
LKGDVIPDGGTMPENVAPRSSFLPYPATMLVVLSTRLID